MASYPGSIPVLTNPTSTNPLNSPSHSTQHINANDEIEAICTELGTLPKGIYPTVRDRLEAIEASITTHPQNTDQGTTNATFYINGITGPYLKGVAGNLQLRNAADAAYVNLTLLDINVQGNLTDRVDSVTVNELQDAVDDMHSHVNKALLDTYTQSDANLADAVTKKHTQNTDTGTTGETFQLNNVNPLSAKIKVDDLTWTIVDIRNAADNAFADIRADNFRGDLQANNADLNRPEIRYNDSDNYWELSNDGVNFGQINAGIIANIADTASVDLTLLVGTLTATVLPAGVDHNSLNNYSANRHIDHTAVTITAGTGLTGGGDISANRTISLSHLGIQSLADPNADRIMFWDDSSGFVDWLVVSTGLQITGLNLTTKDSEIVHNSLSGYVANEHINHTSVSITAGTGLTGGGDISASRTISLSHLGIQSLTDPNADRLMMWDDTDGSVQWVTVGAGLTYVHGTHTLNSDADLTVTLDDAYNNGNTITVDTSAVTLNSSILNALLINSSSNGSHIRFTGDPTVAAPVDGDLWWNGTNLYFYDGATTTDLLAGGGGSVTYDVTQAAHGFAVGDVLRMNGATYVKAQANSSANAEVVGIVSAINPPNDFTIQVAGRITGLAVVAGTVYFLDDDTAGLLTSTAPTDVGDINKPLLIADTNTSGYVFNMRGIEVVATPPSATLDSAYDGGGAGLGRTITVDSGPVALTQSGTDSALSISVQGVLNASKYGLYVYSNAVQVTSILAYFHQDNASSTYDVCNMLNDGTGTCLYLGQNTALAANNHDLYIYSNVAHTVANTALVYIRQNHASSTEPALEILNNGSGAGIELITAGTGHGMTINNTGGTGLYVTAAGGSSRCGLFYVSSTPATNYNVVMIQAGAARTNADTALLRLSDTNASTEPALEILNYGTGAGIEITQNGNGYGIQLVSAATTANALYVQNDTCTTGGLAYFYSNSSSASSRNLVSIISDHDSADNTNLLWLKGDGNPSTGLLMIDNYSQGNALYIYNYTVLGAGSHGLYVYSNVAHTAADSALVKIYQSLTTATEPALEVIGYGDDAAVYMESSDHTTLEISMQSNPSTVNEHALYVWTSNARSSGASRGPLIKFEYTNASTSDPLCLMKNAGTEGVLILEQDGSLEAGDHALEITSAATHGPSTTGDNALVKLVSSSASTTEPVLEIVNSGTAAAIEISSDVKFLFAADATDPTGGGGAATGRIKCTIGGVTRYLAYY